MARHAHMAGSLAVTAPNAATRPHGNTGLAVRLLEHLPRLLLQRRPWLRLDDAQPESVVSYHGAVEVRQTHAGFTVQTCVKGEPDRARATALQRLAQYLAGYNRSGTRLRAAGPIVQREEAPGRWLVSVGLPGVEDSFVAPVSRNGKVRIRPAETEVHAILRMSGRPSPEAIAGGVAAISAALAGTMWWPAGGPMVRLHRRPAILPFANRFEVALPITRLRYATPFQRGACGDASRH
jgi:SOUL heme-binding protein